ncbi:MAG: VCBS domain-containing protein, partial [Mycobacterium sp.]
MRGGVVVQLNIGDYVYQNDVIQTGGGSSIGIGFTDGTAFKMSASARMVLNEFVYDPNGAANSSVLTLVQGTISFVAGQVAHSGDMKVGTPVGTIGIRGTAVNVNIALDVNGQATSVTYSMMDNGVANIYTSTGVLLGTLTNNGNSLVLRPVGPINADVTQVAQTQADKANDLATLQALSQVLQSFSQNNPIYVQPQQAPQQGPQQNPQQNPQPQQNQDSQPQSHPSPGSSTSPLAVLSNSLQAAATSGSTTVTPTNSSNIAPTTPDTTSNPAPITTTTLTGPTNVSIPPSITSADPHPSLTELSLTTASNTPDQTTATSVFTADPNQVLTLGVALNAAVWSGAGKVPAATQSDLATALSASFASDTTSVDNASVALKFNLPDRDLDFLARGETLTLTYQVEITDASSRSSTQTVTVTVTGTNDLPVITSFDPNLSITENAAAGVSSAHSLTGTLNFTDADLTDQHKVGASFFSALWSGGANVPLDTQGALANALTASIAPGNDSTGTATGTIDWSFNLADAKLDFLAQGETLTVTYVVEVADGSGGAAAQIVTVTVTGTNDAPVIAPADRAETGAITEAANTAGAISLDQQSGTIHFADVDLTDRPTAAITAQTAAWLAADGHTAQSLTPAQSSALQAGFAITAEPGNTANGAIDWTYKIIDGNLDFLAAGETATVMSTVRVDDSHGGSDTASVVVTLSGINDAPQILPLSVADPGPFQAIGGANGPVVESNDFSFADLDWSDHHT